MADSLVFRNDHATAMATAYPLVSLHTADPGTTGTNEVTGGTYARLTAAWGTASAGSITAPALEFNVPAGTSPTHIGYRKPDGTFGRGVAVSPLETYVGAGVLRVTPTYTA